MTPAQFEKQIEPRWQKLERLMNDAESSKPKADVVELPATFRQVCHDLSVAQHRMSPQRLTQKLNDMAIRGYRILERRTAGGVEAFLNMMLVTFPQLVRKEWKLFWWCSAIFYVPLTVLITITPHYPEWSMALLGADGMAQAEEMYGHGSDLVETLRAHAMLRDAEVMAHLPEGGGKLHDIRLRVRRLGVVHETLQLLPARLDLFLELSRRHDSAERWG